MKIAIMVIMMILLDRAFPQLVRMSAVGIFSWPDPENAKEFYKRYGYVGFPRTLFAILACVSVGIGQFVHFGEANQLILLAVSVVLWGVFAFVDLWKARK